MSDIALARFGYTCIADDTLGFRLFHVFHHSEHGPECVGTAITPTAAYTKLQRQQWPTHIDAALCPLCGVVEPVGAF